MTTIAFPSVKYSAVNYSAVNYSAAPASPAPRLRITRRGRRVLMALLCTPLVAGALMFAINGGGAVASLDAPSVSFDYVTVTSGQSLWEVAESLAPTADPRDVIDAIVRLNALESADVYAGQQLAVPAQYAD